MNEPMQQMERQPLDAEMEVFAREQARLRGENPCGGFVVIKDDEVLGVWPDRGDALGEGLKKYGDVSFLVRDINEDDEPVFMPCFFRPSHEIVAAADGAPLRAAGVDGAGEQRYNSHSEQPDQFPQGDNAMNEPMQQMERQPLDAEMEVFEREQARLQDENPCGGFVVIKDDEVLGVWRDWVDASLEGGKKYGDVDFLVRDINQTDEPEYFTRDIFAPA